MKIEIRQGDIFDPSHGFKSIVNPVNCEGVMGAGLALAFKKRFPQNFIFWKNICEFHAAPPVIPYRENGQWVFNFPTKNSWRDSQSSLTLIRKGLWELNRYLAAEPEVFCPIGIPALGCGLGRLPWEVVLPNIRHGLPNVTSGILFSPAGFPPTS